jgi:tRNA A-37 threonylcarbamoyl transferase component Bud32
VGEAADTTTMRAALLRMGLLSGDEPARFVPLEGGVASNILRVDLARGPICLKQARHRLKVEAEWLAPVDRNASEVAWFETARALVPEAVPAILGHDVAAHLFAMAYLPPEHYPVWKAELLEGRVDLAVAAAVGERLARIHRGTANDTLLALRFANDETFEAIRLEPYLRATAKLNPERAAALNALAERTAATKRALVHGDISPKNILLGPRGPVFLDAECACYGDPAFDVAFCLNHLLLKCVRRRRWRERYLAAFDALAGSYLARADWEPKRDLEARMASLLPGLLLGRIDGKSPVEYIVESADRELVRTFARKFLSAPASSLAALRGAWLAWVMP